MNENLLLLQRSGSGAKDAVSVRLIDAKKKKKKGVKLLYHLHFKHAMVIKVRLLFTKRSGRFLWAQW